MFNLLTIIVTCLLLLAAVVYSIVVAVNASVCSAVEWYGSSKSADVATASDFQLIGSGNVTRTVHCGAGETTCDPVIVLLTNVVDYKMYYVQVVWRLLCRAAPNSKCRCVMTAAVSGLCCARWARLLSCPRSAVSPSTACGLHSTSATPRLRSSSWASECVPCAVIRLTMHDC